MDIFIREGDFTAADSLLDSIPYLYDLRGNDSMSFNIYKGFKSLQMDWMSDNKNIFQLDSLYISYLEEYADTTDVSTRSQARAILEFAYGYKFCDYYALADSTQKSSQYQSGGNNEISLNFNKSVLVYPNPSEGYVIFEYCFKENVSKAEIIITDVSGKEIEKKEIKGNSGKFLWNSEKLNSGIYFYFIKTITGIESGKIILIK